MEITGRLTADAEVRKLKGNKEVVAFSIAVNDSYKSKDKEKVELTDYFNCSYWLSSKIADSLQKGSIVTVSGRVYLNEYKGKDGNQYASINCHVNSIKIIAGFKRNNTGVPAAALTTTNSNALPNTTEGNNNDDLPF